MGVFVAYYRISTDRQDASGLGLEAQRQAVMRQVGSGHLVAEYTESESGRRHTNRPQLLAALQECQKHRAVLLIGRLDRLARNVAFIASLMDSRVEFTACDLPSANRLSIHILAAVAEHEHEMISKRTKAALEEAKRRGKKLGNPRLEEARTKAIAHHHANRPVSEVVSLISGWRLQDWTLRRIADELNRLSIRPPRGKLWYASSVKNQLERRQQHELHV